MVWLKVDIKLVWLEDIRTGLVERCYNWFGWKILEMVWLEDARTGLVGKY